MYVLGGTIMFYICYTIQISKLQKHSRNNTFHGKVFFQKCFHCNVKHAFQIDRQKMFILNKHDNNKYSITYFGNKNKLFVKEKHDKTKSA